MAKSSSVDVDPLVDPRRRDGVKRDTFDDFLFECSSKWSNRIACLRDTTLGQATARAIKNGADFASSVFNAANWWRKLAIRRAYDRFPGLERADACVRKAVLKFLEEAGRAYADMSWARVAILTILLMAVIGFADSLIGRPVSFRLIYMLPIWVATRLGGGGSGFVAMLIVGVFCTIGDTPFESMRQESQVLNFAIRWISLGSFLLIVLQVEGALNLARQRATRDSLTGLANRYTIETMAEEAIAAQSQRPTPIHLAVIDCDNFKELNDSNGHAFGDHALKMLGRKLETETHGIGHVARLGGDEFIVLFQGVDCDTAAKSLRAADAGFKTILASMSAEGGISFGIATFGEDGQNYASLSRVADERMYTTKRSKCLAVVRIEHVPTEGIPSTSLGAA